jgi:hypothetical protein
VERVCLQVSPDDHEPRRLRSAVQMATGGFANVACI